MQEAVYAQLNDLIKLAHEARGFSFLPKQPLRSLLTGRHRSRLRGRGLNFEELRHYQVGDDIRTMDWKVTNRTGQPHVRVFTEERERSAFLLVDQRISMFFGSQWKMKSVVAAELAALGAWRILDVGDRVGAFIFSDKEIIEVKPHRSRNTVLRILGKIVELNNQLKPGQNISPNPGQLNKALREVERLAKHDALVVIISDFTGWNDETVKRLKRIARHNDLISSLIYDPLEEELPNSRVMVISDGSMQIEVDSRKEEVREKFSGQFRSGVDYLKSELQKHGVPVIPITTVEPAPQQLRRCIGDMARG